MLRLAVLNRYIYIRSIKSKKGGFILRTKMLIALCVASLLSLIAPIYLHAETREIAHEEVLIEPLWDNTLHVTVGLLINNNGRATMSGSVIGHAGTTSITVNAVLERANSNGTFTHIASFNNIQVEGDIWVWERPHYVARGHDYRLTLTATVVRNGTSEVVSLSRTTRAN